MLELNKLVLVGAGGHAKSCLDVINNATKSYTIEGYLDSQPRQDEFWKPFKYLGNDYTISKHTDLVYLVTVGMIKNLNLREVIYNRLKQASKQLVKVYASSAIISSDSVIDEGTICMHQAIVSAGAKIGVNCIINNKSLIEHDSVIGDHCHISTGAIVNADCSIGNNTFISSNATINRGVKIGSHCIVGSGAVLTKDISDNSLVYGVPAR